MQYHRRRPEWWGCGESLIPGLLTERDVFITNWYFSVYAIIESSIS